jgi:hypothetical protein
MTKSSTPARKKDTGELTDNGGHFGTKTLSEPADVIEKPRFSYEDVWILERYDLDPSTVETIDRGPHHTHITLKQPHLAGGYDKVVTIHTTGRSETRYEGEAITPDGHRYRGLHRTDGPAFVNQATGEEKYVVAGRELTDESQLAAALVPTEAQTRTARILSFGLEPDMVDRISINNDDTWIVLRAAHPTGGYTRVVDLHLGDKHNTFYDIPTTTSDGFATSVLHRLDGPARIDGDKEEWWKFGQKVKAPKGGHL